MGDTFFGSPPAAKAIDFSKSAGGSNAPVAVSSARICQSERASDSDSVYLLCIPLLE